MSLHKNLQRLRKEKGLSQEDVAQKLFVSRQSVSKWENGNAEPGVENLKALARLYGVTLDELVGNEPFAEPAPFQRPEEPEQDQEPVENGPYYRAVAFRVAATLVLMSLVPWLTYGRSVTIPFFLLAELVGLFVTAPFMWAVILFGEFWGLAVDIVRVFHLESLLDAASLVCAIVSLVLLTRPPVRARFHFQL